MRRPRRTLTIVAFTLVSCTSQVLPASTPTSDATILRMIATTATIRLASDLTHTYAQVRPTISFDLVETNYQGGLGYLDSQAGVYFLTNHLPGFDESPLWAAPIGQDGIAIITHPDNPVQELSIQALRAIYQGQISNWDALGGENRLITVFSREEGSGTRAEFERLVMGERSTTQLAILAPSSEAVVTSVARDPGGVGYVSMSYLNPSVRALAVEGVQLNADNVYNNTYPLRATLFIAGEAEPQQPEYRMFIGWIQSPAGQAVVAHSHAPLLRPEPENETN